MAELFDLLNAQETILEATHTVTETEAQVVSLTTNDLLPGKYDITVSFVAQYNTINDQLHYQATGEFPSEILMNEANDASEVFPFSYAFPVIWGGGVITMGLSAFTTGVGGPTVDMPSANIMIRRVG